MFDELIILINILILSIIIKRFSSINIVTSFFISSFIIYILFINVNPYYTDFNKYKTLSYIPEEYKPHTFLYNENVDLSSLKYPIIFKPNVCSGLSNNVKIINNIKEANEYIYENDENEIIIQEFMDYDIELGVLYEKSLFSNKGEIKSIVRKQSNSTKIMSSCGGEISCDNLNYLINDNLNKLFEKISNNIPNFNVGRYDIKCKDINSFINCKFYILEANGTMGFNLDKGLDVYNLNYTNIPKACVKVEKWFLYRCLMGFVNIVSRRGYNDIYKMTNAIFMTFHNNVKCKNWEKICPIK
jgi:hypothetical protein